MTRIHIWAPSFSGFGGGIERFSSEVAHAMAERFGDDDVRLFAKFHEDGTWRGMHLVGAGGIPARFQTVAFTRQLAAAAWRERPDLVVTTHLNFAPVARLLKRYPGIPYLVAAHLIEVGPAMSWRRRAALGQADHVLAVSRNTAQRVLDQTGIDSARVSVIGNTVDESVFYPGSPSMVLRRRYGLGTSERVILTVARLASEERYKGYDRVIEALPKIHDAIGPLKYLLVGEGEDRPRVEALIKLLGLERHVILPGFVGEDDLVEHYRTADAFAMPSRLEGFGIVYLEAMACGCPVLAGNCDGSADALADGELGLLVDPTDVDAVADGLIALLRHQGPPWWFDATTLRQRMLRQHGRDAFRSRFNAAIDTVIRSA